MTDKDISEKNSNNELNYDFQINALIHHGRGHKKRKLSVPNAFLKIVQRRILEHYLYQLDVSEYSTTYRKGKSLLYNASPHVRKECVLKLDISHFFDSIDYDMVYLVIKRLGLSIPATTLLTRLCTYKAKLPQGAPTSPYIANLVMKQFDAKLGNWCSKHGVIYTRYCDDQYLKRQILRKGDPLVIKELDRLSRNKADIKRELEQFKDNGIMVKILDIPTTLTDFPPEQECVMDMINAILIEVLGAIAENERRKIRARQREGIEAAKRKNIKFGRPSKPLPDNWEQVLSEVRCEKKKPIEAMRELGISRSCYYRLCDRAL